MNEPFICDLPFDFDFDDNQDFDINFDDLGDFYLPSEIDDFLISDGLHLELDPTGHNPLYPITDNTTGGSNSSSPESGSSDKLCSNGSRVINHPSKSSEESNSSIPGASNTASPESGGSDHKVEEIGKMSLPKRKKGHEDAIPFNSRAGRDDKKRARLIRNRESAQLSRQRRKHYVQELEDKVRAMRSTIANLNCKISFVMNENAMLKQQLNSNSLCPPLTPGMYPHTPIAPMAYPWMPSIPYVMKPQGSKVPLVPIPKLKQQKPISGSKTKNLESKKTEVTRKQVRSVSFLGVLFFILLFGGLVPLVKYGGIGDLVPSGSSYVGGNLLTVHGHFNWSNQSIGTEFHYRNFEIVNKLLHCERGHPAHPEYGIMDEEKGSHLLLGSDGFVYQINGSEQLVASLYVPRSDKLVKIDGNLIIHSLLASEKSIASRTENEFTNSGKTVLATPPDLTLALAIPEVERVKERHFPLFRDHSELQKVLTSAFTDSLKHKRKSTTADGKLRQWFSEDLGGSVLSSGICNEVFQFNLSPASSPSGIVPASSVTNSSREQQQNATPLIKRMNRRTLRDLPAHMPRAVLNITDDDNRTSQNDGFQGKSNVSSMIVSVLVDHREAGSNNGDDMIAPKALSRIFVVVLLDSVKYVTYSCMLPQSGLNLVTT